MLNINEFEIIFSKTLDGKKFRPSDWIERLCALLANYGEDRRLRYSPLLTPATIQGESALLVQRGLSTANPTIYALVMEFVRQNQLQVQSNHAITTVGTIDNSLPRVA